MRYRVFSEVTIEAAYFVSSSPADWDMGWVELHYWQYTEHILYGHMTGDPCVRTNTFGEAFNSPVYAFFPGFYSKNGGVGLEEAFVKRLPPVSLARKKDKA